MIRLLLSLALLFSGMASIAQKETGTLPELLEKYERKSLDSNKVRLLLQIDSIYLYRMPDTRNILDSALLLAREARRLSVSLNFRPGYEDATFLLANSLAEQGDMAGAFAVSQSVKGPLKIHICIMMGERYLFKPGELRQNLDSAYRFITLAEKLSDSLHARFWLYQTLCLKGKYYFARGDIENGKKCFRRMIDDSHQSKDPKAEAKWYSELGRYMPHSDSTYNEVTGNLDHALRLYRNLNSPDDVIDMLEALALLHKLHPDKTGLAEAELLEAITLRKSVGRALYRDYSSLAEINTVKGNYNISLYYALAAVKNMELLNKENFSGGVVYSQLADSYKAVGDIDNSLQYYKKALGYLVDFRTEYLFPICGEIVHALLQKNNPGEALAFLQRFINEHAPVRFIDKEIVAASLGDCFTALRNYEKAESSYHEMIVLDSLAQTHMNQQTVGEIGNTITGSEAYFSIGHFYVERNQFELAKTYLTRAISFQRFAPSLARRRDIHLLLFHIDSAQGRYSAAIQHLQMQQLLQDSIFNDRKSKQIAELQIQYETEKKEKDLQVMRSKEMVKDKELQSSLQARNFTYILVAALVILMAAGYSRYLLKQKNNLQLEAKQAEINQKNAELQHLLNDKDILLNEKDSFLEEKEWLLKEVHHRVKNNLQIIISLLNTQSKYLSNEEAITAIRESRHRMQAMAIIHQKLYDSENAVSINMRTYIGEMTAYLEASFSLNRTLHYVLNIDNIYLDVAQAIPVGLILNEAVTNSIKYAFPGKEHGSISVSMTSQHNQVQLEVGDNGIGLPKNFTIERSETMGLRLIKGLVKQIEGSMVLNSEGGVCIRIKFMSKQKHESAPLKESQEIS